MATSQYLADARDAQAAIHDAGGQMLLEKPALVDTDPTTESTPPGSPRRYPCYGVMTPGGRRPDSQTMDPGALDRKRSALITVPALDFPANIEPEVEDTLTVGGQVWRILAIKTVIPDGVQAITHTCKVER